MTITVYEFESVHQKTGRPVHPASKITRNHPLDADLQLQRTTTVVQVVPKVPVRLGVGGNPEAGDYAVDAGAIAEFTIGALSTTTLRATAA